MQGACAQFLVEDLGSYMLHGGAKINEIFKMKLKDTSTEFLTLIIHSYLDYSFY